MDPKTLIGLLVIFVSTWLSLRIIQETLRKNFFYFPCLRQQELCLPFISCQRWQSFSEIHRKITEDSGLYCHQTDLYLALLKLRRDGLIRERSGPEEQMYRTPRKRD